MREIISEVRKEFNELPTPTKKIGFVLLVLVSILLSPIASLLMIIHLGALTFLIYLRFLILKIKYKLLRIKLKLEHALRVIKWRLKQFVRENITYKLRERRRIKRIRYVVPAPTISTIENAEPEKSSIKTISWKEWKEKVDAEYEDLGHSDREEYRLGALDAGWEI